MTSPRGTTHTGGANSDPPRAQTEAPPAGNRYLPLVDQAVVSGANFAFTVTAARLLNIQEFGVFALMWMVALFANSIHMALIVMPMLTLATRVSDPSRGSYYFRVRQANSRMNLAILAAVLLTATATTFTAVESSSVQLIVSTALLVAAFHSQEFYRRFFFAELRHGLALMNDLVAYISRFILLAAIVALDVHVTPTLLLTTMAGGFGIAVIVGRLTGRIRSSAARPDVAALVRDHSQMARHLAPAALMQWSSINLHTVAAGLILGPQTVGIIRVGQSMVAIGNVFLQSLENTLPGQLSAIHQKSGSEAVYAFFRKYVARGLILLGGAVFLVSLMAEWLLDWVFGAKFAAYPEVVYWFSAIYLLSFIAFPLRATMRELSIARAWSRAYLYSSLATLAVFYPLQKWLGANGVMLGMLISSSALVAVAWLYTKKRIGNVASS